MIGFRGLVIAGLGVAAAGCGPGGRGAVSGRLTLDGKPLAGASVSFMPHVVEGQPRPVTAAGATDADGRFRLEAPDRSVSGAAVGTNRVSFSKVVAGPNGVGELNLIPPKYRGDDSELTFDVPPGGTAEANFDLTSGPPAAKKADK